MRLSRNSWFNGIVVTLLFVALQGVSIFLIAHSSVVQQAGIVRLINSGHHFLWKRQQSIDYYFQLNSINKALVEDNIELRTQLIRYQTTMMPNTSIDSIYSCIGAEVVFNTTAHAQNYLIINRGSNHGVQPDMGVIGDHGVVGIVHVVHPNYSRVISLLNTKVRINARVEPGQATGSLSWDGKSIRSALISDMPQHSHVAVGDTAVTSGLSQIFPARIPLGVVTATDITRGTFLEAQITLFQNFNTLRYVYVVRNAYAQEINNLLVDL
ncbi:MAG: rod shape-determining protein MreC [Prevotellaceae bacterium]|jgi:rod shape-determining protein MreC|nr:rod shape-determining protein MreC [Prevotellaceae bacterium]